MNPRAKILVVEDDDDLRRGLTLRLRSFGYDVVAARDGQAAVSVAIDEHPDLVLLDIGLPVATGTVVLERYADLPELRAIPVVILTGRDPRDTEREIRQFHVAAFLHKPAENHVLGEVITLALRGETTPAQPPPDAPSADAGADAGAQLN